MQLFESDRRAVDLLLDQGQSSIVKNGGPGYAASSVQISSRIRHVEQLLSLLEALPQDEPPADLVDRTLRQLENGARRPAAPVHSLVDSHHPVV